MRLVVLDLEFENQTQMDIIQVGAVKVDLLRRTIEPFFNEFVALPEGVPLSPYISDLTGIAPEDLSTAREASEVFKAFWKRFSEAGVAYRLGGWGDDTDWLIRESERYGVKVPHVKALDLKSTFDFFRFQNGLSTRKRTGLRGTLDAFGLEFEGRHHNGYDDAYNTARLLLEAVKNPESPDQ